MRNQMILVEQKKVDYILEGIKEDIEDAKRMMEKPYTADDAESYEITSIRLNLVQAEAFTLSLLGVEGATEYAQATRECNDELIAWRWAK